MPKTAEKYTTGRVAQLPVVVPLTQNRELSWKSHSASNSSSISALLSEPISALLSKSLSISISALLSKSLSESLSALLSISIPALLSKSISALLSSSLSASLSSSISALLSSSLSASLSSSISASLSSSLSASLSECILGSISSFISEPISEPSQLLESLFVLSKYAQMSDIRACCCLENWMPLYTSCWRLLPTDHTRNAKHINCFQYLLYFCCVACFPGSWNGLRKYWFGFTECSQHRNSCGVAVTVVLQRSNTVSSS